MKLVAKILVTDTQGNILVLRRSGTHPHFAYHWDFPGGEVEPGEEPAAAAAREADEEAGLTIDASDLTVGFSKAVSDELTYVLFLANLERSQPDISTSWEHDAHKWLTPEMLLKEPMPGGADTYYEAVIDWLRSRPA